ncbi:pyridoxal-phosphate dependent enzyme [Dactylosporangium sp. NPDC000521]|uniref:pyridoxal-phosphate dependent enzyme n=1 Tax=Dactylosporangium sp. NPDC000521 TaxID=3363975 RepID=UPI0036B381B9
MTTANPLRDPGWRCDPAPAEVLEFHRRLPGYAPTPLTELPELAAVLGVARLYAKDESTRLGLPAFKALGASWAIHRALRSWGGAGQATIVTATDGNHGRAVARFARQFGHRAAVYVPDGVHPAAVRAIRDEGADVAHVPGDYDTAVAAAAASTGKDGPFVKNGEDRLLVQDSEDRPLAQDGENRPFVQNGEDRLLVQDMAWDGYEDVPGWIVDGYSTLFAELPVRPDLVVVPAGVGSLLQAALTHYRGRTAPPGTAVVSVEPDSAACVLASVAAGHPVTVATGTTSMAGLNCGTVSSLAWPYIRNGLDACTTVTDAQAADAMRDLSAHGVDAGPCGAAALAALRSLRVAPDSTVVLLVTEGRAANAH